VIGFRRIGVALLAALLFGVPILACAPEEGSERWCEKIRETPKSEWSAHEAGVFTGKCAFR
jgi:hypothetical protein